MSVALTTVRSAFVGTGAPANYSPAIYAQTADEIEVRQDGVLASGYSLSGLGSSSGVTVSGTFTNGSVVAVRRKTPLIQTVDTRNNQTILEDVFDAALDRMMLVDQELDYLGRQALRFPEEEDGYLLPAKATRVGGQFFGFDIGTGSPALLSSTALATALAPYLLGLLPGIVKGDPGANTMAFGLFTAAATMSVPVGTDIVRTAGYSVNGKGSADYVYDAAVDAAYVTANPRSSFRTLNGRGFRLVWTGAVDVRSFGAVGDNGVTDDTTPFQTALTFIGANGGGVLDVPQSTYKVTAYLSVLAKTTIRGTGRFSSKITSAHAGGGGANASQNLRNGSIFVSAFAINSSTPAFINIERICLENTNAANIGAGYYDTGGSYINLNKVRVLGFKYGIVFDQSELADIDLSGFENQKSGGAGIWLANGNSLTPGALSQFTNRISVKRSQINQGTTTIGIITDGGTAHVFEDNNYNGCSSHIRAAGVEGLTIRGGEWESCVGSSLIMEYRRSDDLSGVGGCTGTSIYGGFMVPVAGQSAIDIQSGSLEVGGGLEFSTNVAAIKNCVNAAKLAVGFVVQSGVGAIRDGNGTQTFDFFGGGSIFGATTASVVPGTGFVNPAAASIRSSNTVANNVVTLELAHDAAGDLGNVYLQSLIKSVITGYSDFVVRTRDGDGMAERARITLTGLVLPAASSVTVGANKVLGARGASLPADATDLASVIALANAMKARGKTTGGHGLWAD